MRYTHALSLLIALVLALAVPGAVLAAPAQDCRSHEYAYDAGKTPAGFSAVATAGCDRVEWTGSVGPGAGSGTLTFTTVGNVGPTEPGYTLHGPAGGPDAYCRYRAAHEANLYFTNLYGAPVGTEVTVRYECT